MYHKVCFALLLTALITLPTARADSVVLRNGDRLTGPIVKSDEKTLVVNSTYAGLVGFPWEQVVAVESTAPLYLGLKTGEVLVGPVTTVDGRFVVTTAQTGVVTAAKDTVAYMRSKVEEQAYEQRIERYRNPRLIDLWSGYVDFGYSLARGNSDTTNLNVSANANRETTRDKISVYFTSLYANNETTGVGIVTANAIRGGIGYNLNLTPKVFVFGSSDLEYDEFQDLDLRFAPAGGFGYNVFKTDRRTLDFRGGVSLNREFFSTGLSRTSGEALLGQEFIFKYTSRSSLREKFEVFPNVTDLGAYRMNFDSSADTKLWRWLSWQITVSDRFLGNPLPGRKKNDILLTTGFRVSFQKE